MNEHIIKAGLIGTSRQTLESNELTLAVSEIIDNGNFENEEEKYLNALALEVYYQEAGQLGQLYKGEFLDEPISEDLPIMNKKFATALTKIIEMEGRIKGNLLSFFSRLAIEKQVIVPVNLIIPVLKAGKEIVQSKRNSVLNLVGIKGRRICQDYEKYSKIYSETNTSNDWELGSIQVRKEFFESKLEIDEQEAIQMLSESWDSESIKEKIDFLTILKIKGSIKCLPFLENLYFNEFKFDSKEKKTVTKGRNIIASKLLTYDSTPLFIESLSELNNYLKSSKSQGFFKKILSLNQAPFELPNGTDVFWNPENMNAKYGFSESNPDIGRFATDNLYWFACFVEAIPIDKWANLFGLSIKDSFKFFTEDDSFQNKVNGVKSSNLMNSLYNSAQTSKNAELIILLLNSSQSSDNAQLLALLSNQDWENYIIRNNLFLHHSVLESFPSVEVGEWSIPFTQKWLGAMKNSLKESQSLNHLLGNVVASSFNIECVSELDHIQNTTAQASSFYHIWNKHIYLPIKQTVEIKKLITS